MADLNTELLGQPVTLIDNGDGTYRIDLNTVQARRFIRDGELARLRQARTDAIAKRDTALEVINFSISQRDEFIPVLDEANTEITEINTNIAELRDWLIAQGDDPNA